MCPLYEASRTGVFITICGISPYVYLFEGDGFFLQTFKIELKRITIHKIASVVMPRTQLLKKIIEQKDAGRERDVIRQDRV